MAQDQGAQRSMMDRESGIIKSIEYNLSAFKEKSEDVRPGPLDKKWRGLISSQPVRFINRDSTLKREALRNFRRKLIFIPDEPSFNPSPFNLKSLLGGGRRGMKRLLIDCLDILKSHGYDTLLKRYPPSTIGNPYLFRHSGYAYTHRWAKHIYSLGLFKKVLADRLNNDFTALDIGSGYGIFSYLLRHEFDGSHCILLDFPEQLVLAHYFLAMNFPDASIAGFKEVMEAGTMGRDFIRSYDFILVPWVFYRGLLPSSVDLITNFASFGEMKREWFDFYTKGEPFISARYFFTQNRVQSAPTYDTDLDILDYPLADFKKLHFGISPVFSHTYIKKRMFFYEKSFISSQYFEFIGEKK